MPALSAKLDTGPLSNALRRIDQRTGRTALSRTLTGSVRVMETTARREVQRKLNLPVREIRKAMKKRTRLGRTRAEVAIEGRDIPLIAFKGSRQTKSGASIQVKHSGKRTRLRHSFVATMPSGHKGIFQRDLSRQVPRRAPKYSGLRIKELFGPQVQTALETRRARTRVLNAGAKKFRDELQRQLDLALRG